MLGAIIGDIVGSRFEFDPTNNYHFTLFGEGCSFTDDTVCTIAVADAILNEQDYGETIHTWCRRYPNPKGGYGGRFRQWVLSDHPEPYCSFGNGSAMRVSPVAWAFRNAFSAVPQARRTAECTHNHPEGIKGAEAVVMAIHYGDEIRRLAPKIDKATIVKAFQPILEYTGYNICLRRADVLNKFDETCQGTVPVALWIITESTGFEDAIRKAVSLGADADTLGAIVGSIAEAIWGVPLELALEALCYLPAEMKKVVLTFYKNYCSEMFPLKAYSKEIEEEEEEEKEEDARRLRMQQDFEKTIRRYVLLKTTYVAGTQYVADSAFDHLEPYSHINLVRECDNAYDEDAISLYFEGAKIGYIPRTENREIAAMLEANLSDHLTVFVTSLSRKDKYRKISIAIYIIPE